MQYYAFMPIRLLLLGVCWLGAALCHEPTGLTFELPDNEKMCFYEDFQGAGDHVFSYQVIRGGQADVDAVIESPNGHVLYKQLKTTKDSVEFETSRGKFTFCFSNEFSTFTHKVVYFEVRPRDHRPLAVEAGVKRPSVNTQLQESFEAIHQSGSAIMDHQRDYRLREGTGRAAADELNINVQYFSLIAAAVVVFTGFGQVFVLKTLFAVRTKSRKGIVTCLSSLNPGAMPTQQTPPAQRP